MSTIINIGKTKKVPVDLERLLDSRVLVQATSGAGKSWLLQALAEQMCVHIPVIIIDREGEYVSLRQKHDLVLVGEGGEVPAQVKSAKLLARKLVELSVSAVIDISDLKTLERPAFVAEFLEGLIDLPRKLWPSTNGKHTAVIVDEAHLFCPEQSSAVSTRAVIDLQALGRKRGLCGFLATQRLSKLKKDAAAECGNVFIGRTSPVDQRRAADVLGIPANERHDFGSYEDGEWSVIGPAMPRGVTRFMAISPKTRPKGRRKMSLSPPKPSAAIKRVLPQLASVAKEAAIEVKDMASAGKEINRLKRDLGQALRKQPKAEQVVKEKVVVDQKAIEQAVMARDKEWKTTMAGIDRVNAQTKVLREKEWKGVMATGNKTIDGLHKRLVTIRNQTTGPAGVDISATMVAPGEAAAPASKLPEAPKPANILPSGGQSPSKTGSPPAVTATPANGSITPAQQRILNALAWWANVGQDAPARICLAPIAGYTVNGHFNNLLGSLRTGGYVDYPGGGAVKLTEGGKEVAKWPDAPGGLDDLHNAWRAHLPPAHTKILNVVIAHHPAELDRETLASAAGYTVNGHFNNLLGKLRTYGLIPKRGGICGTAALFPEHLS